MLVQNVKMPSQAFYRIVHFAWWTQADQPHLTWESLCGTKKKCRCAIVHWTTMHEWISSTLWHNCMLFWHNYKCITTFAIILPVWFICLCGNTEKTGKHKITGKIYKGAKILCSLTTHNLLIINGWSLFHSYECVRAFLPAPVVCCSKNF